MLSMRQLAKEAGVSICTVSKALRNSIEVNPETRARIRRLAEERGYRPSASLSRVVGRRASSRARKGEPLALIVHSSQKHLTGSLKLLYDSASERARELGYNLELIQPQEFESWIELDHTFWNRGGQAIIIGPQPQAPMPGATLRWEKYAAVCIGQPWVKARLPLVRISYLRAVFTLAEQMKAAGYCKIGAILINDTNNEFQHRAQLAGLCGLVAQPPSGLTVVPPLLLETMDIAAIETYLRSQELDGLIVQRASIYWELKQRRWRIPERLGVAALYRSPVPDKWTQPVAGIVSPMGLMGREAVNLIDVALHHGQYGETNPREIILPFACEWAESLRKPVALG